MKMELMQNIAKVEANAESANKALSERLDNCIDVSNQLKSTMDSNHSEIMAFLMNKSKPSARDETPNQAHSRSTSPPMFGQYQPHPSSYYHHGISPQSFNYDMSPGGPNATSRIHQNTTTTSGSSKSSTPSHNIVINMSSTGSN